MQTRGRRAGRVVVQFANFHRGGTEIRAGVSCGHGRETNQEGQSAAAGRSTRKEGPPSGTEEESFPRGLQPSRRANRERGHVKLHHYRWASLRCNRGGLNSSPCFSWSLNASSMAMPRRSDNDSSAVAECCPMASRTTPVGWIRGALAASRSWKQRGWNH